MVAMKRATGSFFAVLLLLAAVRLFVMAVTPVFEPSEARYAAIAANMARTGDFLVPRFTYRGVYRSFDGKPPLVFQAGGRMAQVLGVNAFAVRLFPFLSALLLGVILYRTVGWMKGSAAARTAVVLYSSSTAVYAAAGFCMTDIPLSCCVAGSVLLYMVYRKDGRLRDLLGIAALLGCGMLIKGPVALVLFGLPVGTDVLFVHPARRFRFGPLACAVVLFVCLAVPWFVLMERANPGFLRYFFVNENILRFLVHAYGDKYGAGRETFRGMSLVWLFVVTLPWSLFPCAGLLRRSPRTWKALLARIRWTPPALGVACITAFWCLTSRVPLAYLLPTVPLFAASCALGRRAHVWSHVAARLFPAAALLAGVALCGALGCTWAYTDKMPGASAPRRVSIRRFSHEFYHGPWGTGHPAWKEPAR